MKKKPSNLDKWEFALTRRRAAPCPDVRAQRLYREVDAGWRYFWSKRGGCPIVATSFVKR